MIIHGNAVDECTVGFLEALQADALICDPPYSAHVHNNAVSTRTDGAGPRQRDFGFDYLSDALRDCIAQCAGHVSGWSVLFSDLESTHLWRNAVTPHGARYIRELPWIRWSQPQISGDRPPTGAEAVLHFHRSENSLSWNGWGGLTHYDSRAMRGQYKHPTEKPLDLMLEIVSSFTSPGARVLDPCAGSGTTALACRLLGRECVAIEVDEDWARRASTREEAPLNERDEARAKEWIERVRAQVAPILSEPPGKNEQKAWERCARRKADADIVGKVVGL
jgi:site-specific DNA-methyltransferase (adenine-specific)